MSRYLREYKHRASPIRAEIMQKRAVDNQTLPSKVGIPARGMRPGGMDPALLKT